MGRKQRNQGAAFSLFAFQDIICSVIGIMILVVILLVLELITKADVDTMGEGKPPPSPEMVEQNLQLQEAIKQKGKALEEAQAKLKAMRAALASGPDSEEGNPSDEVSRIRAKIRENAASLLRAQQREAFVRDAMARLGGEKAKLLAKIRQAEKEADEAEQEEKQVTQRSKRLVFLPGEGIRETPIVVEMQGNQLRARSLETGSEAKTWDGPFEQNATAFLRWAGAQRDAFFVILVRPEKSQESMALVQALKRTGQKVGHEALPQDWNCLF